MKLLHLFSITFLLITGSSPTKSSNTLSYKFQETSFLIDTTDTSSITVLPISELNFQNEPYSSIALTKAEFSLIDSLIKDLINKFNKKELTKQFMPVVFNDDSPILLDKYNRQYIPYLAGEERIVTVNCFSKAFVKEVPNWKKYYVSVDGGGKAFFHIIINLTLKKYTHFWINAPL